ncbi:uncharacterized protein VDAG_04995 [Verticillium dahliae VdLs.17]|uniref:Zn(2)-C6 fungal-type domain-containing protein n=1 Tax=Verticillium dahliae (strain VdLs.17 / ATCC MYA-4575 / FGSC 10137) TaxID=498257 RepID=G2X4B3_VERDV|nr:uncharacterized protein VDAG_04995 [Verticillium dahliae VdLs.17]EGY23557.1 hypothetical protein VDAG_04995 [Verticillium dahliae VdLs.17]
MELDEDAKPNLTALNRNLSSGGCSDSFKGERNGSVDDSLKHGTDSSASAAKAPVKRRAPIACRRCRRMRSKCIHEKASPPCNACKEAGLGASDCIFPVRGQPDDDRDYRHPRMRAEKASKRDLIKTRREVLDVPVFPLSVAPADRPKHADEWDLMPPLPEIVEAVHLFTRKYFQLGFIPKQLFPARLQRDHRSVSVFLLLSILSISARFSLPLTRRYQGEIKAADFFMERASTLALNELYQEPTLERCQAFYLLSIAQQGSGWRNRSYINLGIATRMAVLMHLHREETYVIKVPTKELVIKAESARRTLWMLHSQDNLHCGAKSPISLAASDITCLLPSDENDFANGNEPNSRAALEDTPPARENPSLIHQPTRSLFASLIQAHYYWGKVARRAMVSTKSSSPWDPTSEYSKMAASLASWEQQLPPDHKWSMVLLKGHKSVGEDLAYMSVTMVTKLCNVVLRRPYLDNIIHPEPKSQAHRVFFSHLSDELFRNVRDLFEQIDNQFSVRGSDESVGAQMALWSVFDLFMQIQEYLLMESKQVWPLASRWLESLERFSRDPKAATVSMDGGMADGNDRILRPLQSGYSPSLTGMASNQGKNVVPASPLPGPMSPSEDLNSKSVMSSTNASPTTAPVPRFPPSMRSPEDQHQLPVPGHHLRPQHQILPQPAQHLGHKQSMGPGQSPVPPQQHATFTPSQLSPASSFGAQQQQQQQPLQQNPHQAHHQQQQYQHQAAPFVAPGHQQASQGYAAYAQQQDPYPQSHNPMGVLPQAAFDPPPNVQQTQQQHVIAGFPQVQSLPPQASFDVVPPMQPQLFTPPTPTALGPGNDGYEGELQSWFDESAQAGGWVGNGAGMGMGYY